MVSSLPIQVGLPENPIKELQPRIPEPYASNIMYTPNDAVLEELS